MLRESIELKGESINLDGLADPACTKIEGIPNSESLLRFANAFMGDDHAALVEAREALAKDMSVEAMVDVAGIASNFQRMVRIADSTGIPSDAPTAIMQADLVEQLGLDKFVSAANTKAPSWIKGLILKFIAVPQVKKMIKERSSQ